MKVVHVVDSLRGGGAEKLLETTLPRMRAVGIEPAVVFLNDETECLKGLLDACIPTLCLRPGQVHGFRGLQRSRAQRFADLKLAGDFCRTMGAQLLHAHLHGSYLFTPDLAKVLEVPYCVSEHLREDPWQVDKSLRARLLRRLYIRSYRGAAAVVCVSDAVRAFLHDNMRLRSLKYRVVENAIDERFFRPIPHQSRDIDVIMVGRISRQKGYPFAIDVFRRLSELKPDLRAMIVGSGALEAEVRSRVTKLRLERHVEFAGRKSGDEVVELMDRAKACYMPSVAEGFGIAAAEALARGLQTVLSDIPVFESLFSDQPGVQFVRHGDTEASARALLTAIQQPILDRQAGLQRFTLAHHCQSMANVYRSALAPPSGG